MYSDLAAGQTDAGWWGMRCGPVKGGRYRYEAWVLVVAVAGNSIEQLEMSGRLRRYAVAYVWLCYLGRPASYHYVLVAAAAAKLSSSVHGTVSRLFLEPCHHHYRQTLHTPCPILSPSTNSQHLPNSPSTSSISREFQHLEKKASYPRLSAKQRRKPFRHFHRTLALEINPPARQARPPSPPAIPS